MAHRRPKRHVFFLTNQVLDFLVLKFSNVDFLWLRAVAAALLLLQMAVQYRVVSRAGQASPVVAAVAVALGIWSLSAGAYWYGTAIAYQQALPTLFGTLMLVQFVARDGSIRWHRFRRAVPARVLHRLLASGVYFRRSPLPHRSESLICSLSAMAPQRRVLPCALPLCSSVPAVILLLLQIPQSSARSKGRSWNTTTTRHPCIRLTRAFGCFSLLYMAVRWGYGGGLVASADAVCTPRSR